MWNSLSFADLSANNHSSFENIDYNSTRTKNYQSACGSSGTSSNITGSTSALPFKAFQTDRDHISVIYCSMKSGNRIISTDDTLSLPLRTLQFDQEGGFNRIVMNGPAYGKVIDKGGNPVYDAGFMIGSGYHQITQGNYFISTSETHSCLGKIRPMETECSKYQKLFAVSQILSSMTMYGRKPDGSLKYYDSYYERHLYTIIEGRVIQGSRGMYSHKCGSRIIFHSTPDIFFEADCKTHYDEIENILNSGANWPSAVECYKNKLKNKKECNLPKFPNEPYGIDLISEKGSVIIRAKKIVLEAEEIHVISTSNEPPKTKKSWKTEPSLSNQHKIKAADPYVKLCRGFDDIPANQKAIVEHQQDEKSYY